MTFLNINALGEHVRPSMEEERKRNIFHVKMTNVLSFFPLTRKPISTIFFVPKTSEEL